MLELEPDVELTATIEEDVVLPLSLRMLYAPVREQIKADGISDDELDAYLKEAREEVHQKKTKV